MPAPSLYLHSPPLFPAAALASFVLALELGARLGHEFLAQCGTDRRKPGNLAMYRFFVARHQAVGNLLERFAILDKPEPQRPPKSAAV